MEIDSDIGIDEKQSDEKMMQIVCFKLVGEEYAVPITDILEVVKLQKITLVPQMPDFVLGVMNLRGNVVTVFDLRKSFKLPAKEASDLSRIIVLTSQNSIFSVIVDEISDTIKIELSSLDALPERKMHIRQECVKGVGLLDKRMIVILDVDKINAELNTEIAAFRQKKEA